jgi:phosphoribosylformylglycinamidine synthase subunit PurQ / glutaminase
MKPRVNVLYFPGTNCQRETLHAFEMAGGTARQVFAEDVLSGRDRMDDADILCIPGGFCYGDHVRAGLIAGSLLSIALCEQLEECRKRPVLCICNGFQIGVRAGFFGRGVTLANNDSGTFLNRPWQKHLVPDDHGTVWLKGLEGMALEFPCAHGEGKFLYTSRDGWHPALYYPADQHPDGTTQDIAGIATPDGLVFGLMNHPERAAFRDENVEIFRNGLRAV